MVRVQTLLEGGATLSCPWLTMLPNLPHSDLDGATIADASPPQVVVGDEVTLKGKGWIAGQKRNMHVRVVTTEEGTKVRVYMHQPLS